MIHHQAALSRTQKKTKFNLFPFFLKWSAPLLLLPPLSALFCQGREARTRRIKNNTGCRTHKTRVLARDRYRRFDLLRSARRMHTHIILPVDCLDRKTAQKHSHEENTRQTGNWLQFWQLCK